MPAMGAMILPLIVVMLAGVAVIGAVIAERYPVSTWRERLAEFRAASRREDRERVKFVSEDVRLDQLWVEDDSSAYTGTDRFEGLVGAVERTMDSAESRAASMRRSRDSRGGRKAESRAAEEATAH